MDSDENCKDVEEWAEKGSYRLTGNQLPKNKETCANVSFSGSESLSVLGAAAAVFAMLSF